MSVARRFANLFRALRWTFLGLVVLLFGLLMAHPWLLAWLLPHVLARQGLSVAEVNAVGYQAIVLENLSGAVGSQNLAIREARVPLPLGYLRFLNTPQASERPALVRLQGVEIVQTSKGETDSSGPALTPARLRAQLEEYVPRIRQYLPGVSVEALTYQPLGNAWRLEVSSLEVDPTDLELELQAGWHRGDDVRHVTLALSPDDASEVPSRFTLTLEADAPLLSVTGPVTLTTDELSAALAGALYEGPLQISARLPADSWRPQAAEIHWRDPQVSVPELNERRVSLDRAVVDLTWDGAQLAADVDGRGTYTRPAGQVVPWELAVQGGTPGAPLVRIEALAVNLPWVRAKLRQPVGLNWQTFELDAMADLQAEVPLQRYFSEGTWPDLQVSVRARPLNRATGVEYRADFDLPTSAPVPGHVSLDGQLVKGRLDIQNALAQLTDVGSLAGKAVLEWDDAGTSWQSVRLTGDLSGTGLGERLPSLAKLPFAEAAFQLEASGPVRAPRYQGEVSIQQLDLAGVRPLDVRVNLEGEGMQALSLQPALSPGADDQLAFHVQVERGATDWQAAVSAIDWRHASTTLQLAKPFRIKIESADGMALSWTGSEIAAQANAPILAWQEGTWTTASGGHVAARIERIEPAWLTPWLERDLPRVRLDLARVDVQTEAGVVVGGAEIGSVLWLEGQDVPVNLAATLEPQLLRIDRMQVGVAETPIVRGQGFLPIGLGLVAGAFDLRLAENAPFELNLDVDLDRPRVRNVLHPLGLYLGTSSLLVDLEGTLAQPTGKIHLRADTLDFSHTKLKEPLQFDAVDLQASVDAGAIEINQFGLVLRHYNRDRVRLSASVGQLDLVAWIDKGKAPDWRNLPIDLHIERLPFATFMPVARQFLQAEGSLQGDLEWRNGAFADSALRFENLAFRPTAGGLTLRQFDGTFALRAREVELQNVQGMWSGQPLKFAGRFDFANLKAPIGELRIEGQRLELVRQSGLLLRGDVDVRVALARGIEEVSIAGRLGLRDSMLLRDLRQLVRSGPASVASHPPFFSVSAKPMADWTLDLDIEGDRFMRIQAPFISGQLSTDLRLEGTLADPRLIGDIPLQAGAVRFPFAKIPLDAAAARITLENPHEVKLEASGQGYCFGYDVQLTVDGTMSSPSLRLSSTPPLPEESILLMLTTGSVPTSSGDTASGDGSSGAQRAGTLAYYVGQDFFSPLFQSGGSERLRIMQGGSLSQFGQRTTAVEFMLNDTFSLIGEYDEYGDYNIDVKWNIFER